MNIDLQHLRRSALSLAIALVSSPLLAQENPEQDDDIEVLIVTGKQQSLVDSLAAKRNADSVRDGISSEELGLFPDANVADSLAHITGVSVERSRGGEGQGVNIRGLGAEFSIVTMNNRLMATDSEGREFAFDVLPSEVISEAWVYKSVTAATLEGSIGGAINLVTARPFDYDGKQGSFSIEGSYNDKARDTGYKLTAVASNTYADDTIGVLFSALYSDLSMRTDELSDLHYGENWDWDHDGDKGYVDWQDSSYMLKIPSTYATTAHIEDRERIAFSSALQFRPNDKVDIVLDGLYTRLDSPAYGYTQSYYMIGRSSTWSNPIFEGAPTEMNPEGTILTGMTMENLIPELVSITDHRVVDTYQVGLNGSFQATDTLKFIGDIYVSNASRKAGGKDKFVVAHGVGGLPNTATFSLTPNGLPNIVFDFDENSEVQSIADLVDDSQFGPHDSQTNGVDIEDEVQGASITGNWAPESIGGSFSFIDVELASIDFGVTYNERTKDRMKYDNQHARGLFDSAPFTFDQTGINVVRPFPVKDFLSDISGDFPRQFVGFDIDAYQQALEAADGNPAIINPDTGEPYPENYSDNDIPLFNANESFSVTEETLAAYVQANLQSDRWRANLGLRHVTTDTTSNGWLWEIERIDALSEWDYVVIHRDPEPIAETNSYSKLLPSVNIAYDLSDTLQLRLAYAQVMARASLNQLSTQVDDASASWGEWTINRVGNPQLSPVEAEQADISLEWYFTEGSAITGAIFKKNINGFIQDWREKYPGDPDSLPVYPRQVFGTDEYIQQPFNVFEPQNLDKAKVLGYEFAFQHFFDSGFGITANYTYIDTESYISGVKEGVLAGVPDTTYSATLLYGADNWSAQISADHTESYITSHWSPLNATGETTYKSTADSMTWVSASISYNLLEDAVIYAEVSNLMNDNWHAYQGRKDIPGSYSEWGRKMNVGLRYKF